MKSSKIKKIYIAEYKGIFKIGVSKNVELRMKQLSCGCPTIKCIYQSEYISNAFAIETFLHQKYKDKEIGGEWFSDISKEDVIEFVEKNGNLVDFKKEKEDEINRFSNYLSKIFDTYCENNIKEESFNHNDLDKIKQENENIFKFGMSISGIDIPNIYSDLIYDVLFDKNTEQLIEKYKPKQFESFRNYLSDEQNEIIKKYMCLVGALINEYWGYDQIKEFVKNNTLKMID